MRRLPVQKRCRFVPTVDSLEARLPLDGAAADDAVNLADLTPTIVITSDGGDIPELDPADDRANY